MKITKQYRRIQVAYKFPFVFTTSLIFSGISVAEEYHHVIIGFAYFVSNHCLCFCPSLLGIAASETTTIPIPIIGNAVDVPAQKPWITYMKWSKEFNNAFPSRYFTTAGDIVGLKTMDMHMIVLHKIKDTEMLFEKRSGIYSDRPVLPVVKL